VQSFEIIRSPGQPYYSLPCSRNDMAATLCEVPLLMLFNYNELVVNHGEQAQLDCGIKGNYSQCFWEKDYTIFQVEDVYKGMHRGLRRPDNQVDNQCGIVIDQATNETHGTWTCIISHTL
ncbi:unnamed protein product, partial [Meganyctiphanes norvegica]